MKKQLVKGSLLAMFLLTVGCGSSEEESTLFQESADPFLTEAADAAKWSSRIFRVDSKSPVEMEKQAAENLDIDGQADFYVVFSKAPTLKAYVFKLTCGETIDETFGLRSALGLNSEPKNLAVDETNEEYQAIFADWNKGGKNRTIQCAEGETNSSSIGAVLAVKLKENDSPRIYLKYAKAIDSKIGYLLLDNSCEDGVLTRLGFGSRAERKNEDYWLDQQGSYRVIFPSDTTSRIAMPCIKGAGLESLRDLATSSGGSEPHQLYSILRARYAPGGNGDNPIQFEKAVEAEVMRTKTLDLSGTGYTLSMAALLDLKMMKPGTSEPNLDTIRVLDLSHRPLSSSDLDLLLERFAKVTQPVTIIAKGPKLFLDASFLERIKGNNNVNLILEDKQISQTTINCPVDGLNASVANLCVRTVPAYQACLSYYTRSDDAQAVAFGIYLDEYELNAKPLAENTLATTHCRERVKNLVARKAIVLENKNLRTLEVFDRLPKLKALIVPDNKLTHAELNALKYLPALEELSAPRNSIETIPTLGDDVARNLQSLNLSENRITSLTGIDRLKNLAVLDMTGNPLTSIDGLKGLKDKLVYLNLANTGAFKASGVGGLNALKGFSALQFLDISATQLTTDTQDFANAGLMWPNLISLNLSSNEISGEASNLAKLNGSFDVQNKFAAISMFGTRIKNLQAYIAPADQVEFFLFRADDPNLQTLATELSGTKNFYSIVYGDTTSAVPDQAAPNQKVAYSLPKFAFDPISVDCTRLTLQAVPDVRDYCKN